MAGLINRAALSKLFEERFLYLKGASEQPLSGGYVLIDTEIQTGAIIAKEFLDHVRKAPAVDAVEVEVLKAWLYEIAMNNTNNYLGDACEEIISRLDGLRVFARERKTDATN